MTSCLTLDLVVHPTQHVFCHNFHLDWFRNAMVDLQKTRQWQVFQEGRNPVTRV